MIDLSLLSGALGSVQAVSDITKSMIGMKNASDVNAKAIELQTIIFSLHGDIARSIASQAQISQENEQLKNELAAIEDFRSDAKRYKLFEPWPGALVYALKESMSGGEPAHYICAHCYQSRRKSVLYSGPGTTSKWCHFICPACKTQLPTGRMESGLSAEFPPE